MTKHTAAPWHVGMPPPNGEQAIGAQNGMMVAVATTGVGMKEETLANARLIAAAPELLEALKDLLDKVSIDDWNEKVYYQAQAAIAKAEEQA